MGEGFHILGDLLLDKDNLYLKDVQKVKQISKKLLDKFGFKIVGEVSKSFDSGGYSLVIALCESHLAFHSWPEIGYLALDLYTCNYKKENQKATQALFEELIKILNPTENKVVFIERNKP